MTIPTSGVPSTGARKVIVTPPTIQVPTYKDILLKKRLVTAYARVSTDSRDQLNSYEAQVGYYTELIQSNPQYEFVGMYSDEGITGVNADRREGFQRMVRDGLAGKFDLILIKSISRLGRNTVLVLSAIRQLKEKGVEIYFENENISTLECTSEVLLTIFCSLAQEESRRISENVKWGLQRRMESGKVSVPYSRFLGYDKGENGVLKINEAQAKVVRQIYRNILGGMTIRMIADDLTKRGIPTPGGSTKWSVSTVRSILSNEKYKGDAIMGKTFTPDFLTKKQRENKGESFRYEFQEIHPAIIPRELFELVQAEMARRKGAGQGQSGVGAFSSRLVCGCCGRFYGPKVWNSNNKYRRTVWQCNAKYKNAERCDTPHFTEEQLRGGFVEAFNSILSDKDALLADMRGMARILTDTAELDQQHLDLVAERAALFERMTRLVRENAQTAMDQEDFNRQYYVMEATHGRLGEQIEVILREIAERRQRCGAMELFIEELAGRGELLAEFDESLWFAVASQMTAHRNGSLTVEFRSGMEITVQAK